MPPAPLGLRNFVAVFGESSRRTRTIMLVLVVASVLALVGFLSVRPVLRGEGRFDPARDPADRAYRRLAPM